MLQGGAYGETYNIGSDNEWKNIDLVKLICNTVNEIFAQSPKLHSVFPDSPCAKEGDSKSLITFVKDRPGHDTRYAVNAKKIKSELGFTASVSFDEGLRSTIEWYLENQEWWLSIRNGK